MTSRGADKKSLLFVAVLPGAVLLIVSLTTILRTGGRLHWDTQLFPTEHLWLSGFFLCLATFVLLRGSRSAEWDVFSPLRLFYSLWFGLLALGCLELSTAETPFTLRFWVTVTCGLFGFYAGSLLARKSSEKGSWVTLRDLPRHWKIDWVPSRALLAGGMLCTLCLVAFGYAYLRAGVAPLLADDPNAVRATFAVSSFVARLALSAYLVIQIGYVGIVHLKRYKPVFLAMMLIAVAVVTLMTVRSFLLFAVWIAAVLFHYGCRRVTPRAALLVVLIAYPVAKLAVDVRRFYENDAFNRVLDKIEFPDKLRAFAPDYLYFSMTSQMLDHLTFTIPNEIDYQYGWYTAYPIRVFWTPRQGEGFRGRLDDLFWERSYDWSPVQSVTTTYMGIPYADFGIPGVFVFSCIFGWLSVRAYESMRRQPTFWRVFLYSQISLAIGLSIYGNYLTLFEPYWNIAIMGLIHYFASSGPKPAQEGPTVEVAFSS